MRKLIFVTAGVVAAGLVVKRLAPRLENIDWEQKFANMPDDAPPKWMFRNISEIRDNTQRIIDLLDARPATPVVGLADPAAV